MASGRDRGGGLHGRLLENIAAVSHDPTVSLDTRTFEEAELVLPEDVQGADRLALIETLASLLPQLQQDATPAVNFLLRLIEPFTYADILAFAEESFSYVDGLAAGEQMVPFNRLMLAILEKATLKSADAAHVASMLETMLALVRLWLCTSDTGIASRASQLLINLMKIDQEIELGPDARLPGGGQGLVWKRIFGDRDVYATFFEACSLSGPPRLKIEKSQRTLAQARLMEWLPAVGAMDWSAASRSHHPQIEQVYGVNGGLIAFAVLHMVDYKDDILMYRCLIDFYSDLLGTQNPSAFREAQLFDSPPLLYLIAEGIHARTAAIYLQLPGARLEPVEAMFLYGPAAKYIATYASTHPEHFLASQMPKQINERLLRAFDLSSAKWAHAESPKHDLHLVASLPRQALLPGRNGSGDWHSSPLSLLPSNQTNADVLDTLATVFQGPDQQVVTFPSTSSIDASKADDKLEASLARALYYHYIAHNPTFWKDIVSHANTVVLKDLALAAIRCLTSVITANWSTDPDQIMPSTIAAPDQAHLAILSPPALEFALPYLLKPPQTFANLVGGRGDAESAAYKVASAKFDALRALHAKLVLQVEQEPKQGYEDILRTLGRRISEGPLSREGDVGGRIGTLEL